jgi:hypothetical protein
LAKKDRPESELAEEQALAEEGDGIASGEMVASDTELAPPLTGLASAEIEPPCKEKSAPAVTSAAHEDKI